MKENALLASFIGLHILATPSAYVPGEKGPKHWGFLSLRAQLNINIGVRKYKL